MNLIKDINFMKNLEEDIEHLSKALYLDNPDLWLDFLEKSNDKVFDEMSLFFAAKYNYVSIIKFAVEVNNFDISSKSKNKSFKSVKNHLISIARTENSIDVLTYLCDEEINDTVDIVENPHSSTNAANLDISYTCPHCNSNIFETGYKVLISSTCKYSTSDRKIVRCSPEELNSVTCVNCNKEINDITPKKLEALITVENCSTCGSHIPTIGILKEVSTNFNKEKGIFEDVNSTFCCKSCRKPLENIQLRHFDLI
ncbi:hypothetical protein LZ906_014425 [Paraclostridium ghonii]|uniref:hypothetical protein n=1 Tax=Paraclostridium ghonii TaxID=29358 RepID=UPI00202CC94D|nr:hypothetical protein [Paeniclostridium ghonii]MCM0166814.1 hypothetical protein [Paeniclostridium ghonii]